jgi:hypothetical protein
MAELTLREDELLRHIQVWYNQKQANLPVERRWIEQRMSLSTTRISDIKKGLVNKGFLDKDRINFTLTTKALSYLNSVVIANSRIISPVQIPVLGQVKAGRTKQDEIRVDIADQPDNNTNTIAVPYLVTVQGTDTSVGVG